jgi:hypothetical protein
MKQAQETKSTHTQGEWKSSNRILLHVEMGNQWICQLSNLENTNKNFLSDEYDAEEKRLKEEQEANAKLIAAAPDLLQALITIVQGCNDDNGFSSLAAIEAIAQQAINKATL